MLYYQHIALKMRLDIESVTMKAEPTSGEHSSQQKAQSSFVCRSRTSPFRCLPGVPYVADLLAKGVRVVLAAVLDQPPVHPFDRGFVVLVEQGRLDVAVGIVVAWKGVGHRIEGVVVHDEVVRIVLFVASDCPSEVVGSGYL